jgi:hypothetical protein
MKNYNNKIDSLFLICVWKSAIKIVACIGVISGFMGLAWFAAMFLFAETLSLVEVVVDRTKKEK